MMGYRRSVTPSSLIRLHARAVYPGVGTTASAEKQGKRKKERKEEEWKERNSIKRGIKKK